MSNSSVLSRSHPRSNQGHYGHLGGLKGNCVEAKKQGARGSRWGKKGGKASKGSKKAGTNFKQNLLLVTLFRVHENLATIITKFMGENFPDQANQVLREFIYGEYHSLMKARQMICILRLQD